MPKVKKGIYLESKKGTIGTGHTAKDVVYNNFWVTVGHKEGKVVLQLLDNDLAPTAFRETVPLSRLSGENFRFLPEKHDLFVEIAQKIRARAAAQAQPGTNSAAEKEAPPAKPRAWWQAEEKEIQPGDIFKTGPKKQKQEPEPAGKWWETGASYYPANLKKKKKK